MSRIAATTAFLLAAWCATAAQAQPGAVPTTRGQLLYANHCIECHTQQMHWRENKLARDWPSLRAQVVRWQATAKLNWTDEDIDEVARHLNETFYQFPRPQAMR